MIVDRPASLHAPPRRHGYVAAMVNPFYYYNNIVIAIQNTKPIGISGFCTETYMLWNRLFTSLKFDFIYHSFDAQFLKNHQLTTRLLLARSC